jgi:hypothetical protein
MCPEGAVPQEPAMSIRHKVSLALAPLLLALAGGRTLLSPNPPTTRPDQDSATMMEKLDAALNNMSHGLCMFGPDDRLLLWNIISLRRWNYLQAFPFDKIKIDQTFIAKINNFQAEAIIHAILGLGRALALPMIAEGVETEDQRAGLPCQGGIRIQGYLIGRPQPITDHWHLITGVAVARETAVAAG